MKNDHPLMACGCVAQGTCSAMAGKKYDPPIPCCIVHDCIEVAEAQPDLTGRIAHCAYYKDCGRHEPSSLNLAFFVHYPEKPFDEYYCGCHGWD